MIRLPLFALAALVALTAGMAVAQPQQTTPAQEADSLADGGLQFATALNVHAKNVAALQAAYVALLQEQSALRDAVALMCSDAGDAPADSITALCALVDPPKPASQEKAAERD